MKTLTTLGRISYSEMSHMAVDVENENKKQASSVVAGHCYAKKTKKKNIFRRFDTYLLCSS